MLALGRRLALSLRQCLWHRQRNQTPFRRAWQPASSKPRMAATANARSAFPIVSLTMPC